MISTNNGEGMVMPVQPMGSTGVPYVGGYGNGGLNDSSSWLILFIILAMSGNWGGFGNGGGSNGSFPWLVASNTNTDNLVTSGFNQAATSGALAGIQSSITSGFGDVQNSLCSGFAGVNQGITNGFSQAEIANNARQIATMQQDFANQTAMLQGFNSIASQFANCCCENRLGLANLTADLAREACADRQAVSDALQAVSAQNSANTQRILDQMCQDKIDAKNEQIQNLQNQLYLANLRESQNGQTATIEAGQRALANEIEQYVLPTPRPAYVVQNPNCCTGNFGTCGCGNNF